MDEMGKFWQSYKRPGLYSGRGLTRSERWLTGAKQLVPPPAHFSMLIDTVEAEDVNITGEPPPTPPLCLQFSLCAGMWQPCRSKSSLREPEGWGWEFGRSVSVCVCVFFVL